MNPDTTNQAIADALNRLIQAKQGQKGPGGGKGNPPDPRLKQPKTPGTGGGGTGGGTGGSGLGSDDDDDDWEDPNAPKGPKIGDRGNKAIQDAEEAERQANAYKDGEEQEGEGTGDDEKARSHPGKQSGKSANLNRKSDDEIDPVERARLERIQQSLEDSEIQQQAIDETERAVLDSQQRVAEKRKRRQYRELTNDPALRFLDSVKCFIRDQVAYLRTPSWKRFSKRTVEVTPLIQKGRARTYNQKIPVINVYFDHSGSWGDSDIAVGKQAIKALSQYERKGEIRINVKYFADNVYDNPAAARREGGTSACQKILDDIKATHCNNVIIMTDADMDWHGAFTTPVTVDGAVWFLFRGYPCTELTKYLKGKQLTKQYLLK